jgi:signal transduction histidine kinase/CheY-like chemotaxis protein
MLGFPDRETLLSTKVTELFVDVEDRRMESRILSEVGDVRRYEITLRRFDGQEIWVEDYARVVRDDTKKIKYYQGSMINITERKRGERELLKTKEAAEEASRVKGLFLANMSHEIRTPLNGILGTLDLLANDDLSENQRELIEIMRDSSRSLLKIVDNILDLDISDSGHSVIHSEPFDIKEIIRGAVDHIRPGAEEKQLRLKTKFANNIPASLVGDRQRIKQVLINLLENAIKFTHSGYIQVKTDVKTRDNISVTLHIKISDTGIGIAEHQLKQIFEPFTQADNSYTRQFGGAGLGATISRKWIEMMGGEIWAQSPNPDSKNDFPGSIFHVVLPLKQPVRPFRRIGKKNKGIIKGLLVEDNRINQKLIARFLKRLGIEVNIVGNGQEAIKEVKQNKYDVIFMDIQMPVMNGLEATRQIRKSGYEIPIIAVTAHAIKGYREKCLQAGMDDYVVKPIHFEKLASVVNRLF